MKAHEFVPQLVSRINVIEKQMHGLLEEDTCVTTLKLALPANMTPADNMPRPRNALKVRVGTNNVTLPDYIPYHDYSTSCAK